MAEVAHLCSRGIQVNVLVSQSNERALRSAYDHIGFNDTGPVRPLLLRSSDLSIDRSTLAENEGPAPLYMKVIQRILRQMAIPTTFDYKHFRRVLESFMHPDDLPIQPNTWRPQTNEAHSGKKMFDLVFCPAAFVGVGAEAVGKVRKLGFNVMTMKTRSTCRLGPDGGMSLLASSV